MKVKSWVSQIGNCNHTRTSLFFVPPAISGLVKIASPPGSLLCLCIGEAKRLPSQDGPMKTSPDKATSRICSWRWLDRGRPPELKGPHWRYGVIDSATGAACTLRPHTEDKQHQGREAVQGAGRSTRVVTWTGEPSGRDGRRRVHLDPHLRHCPRSTGTDRQAASAALPSSDLGPAVSCRG
jgi:hypothetical protein